MYDPKQHPKSPINGQFVNTDNPKPPEAAPDAERFKPGGDHHGEDIWFTDSRLHDLTGSNLRDATLVDAYNGDMFDQCDLSGAYAAEGGFRQASLRQATVTGADFTNADMKGADLTQANWEVNPASPYQPTVFTGANLQGVKFNEARLRGADFTETDCSQADFSAPRTTLTGSRFDGCTAYKTDFHDALMPNASLRHANLTCADFTGAELEGADFTGSHMDGADLHWALLGGADFTGTHWAPGKSDAKGKEGTFGGATSGRTDTEGNVWPGACFRNAVFEPGLHCQPVRFGKMDVSHCDFRGADLMGADFSDARNMDEADWHGVKHPPREVVDVWKRHSDEYHDELERHERDVQAMRRIIGSMPRRNQGKPGKDGE